MAAAADPTAKLYYNDYNLEYGEAKHKGALRIVKLVQSWGVKIDGVGLQGHLTSESTGTQSVATPSVAVLTMTLQDYADLKVDVAYTELDIRSNTPSNSNKESVAAAAWGRVAQSCINVSRCVGITIWVCSSSTLSVMIEANFFVGCEGRIQLGSWYIQRRRICAAMER
jgi:endo-1,4-beta-xylanase